MNGHSHRPLSDGDIVAAREKAAGSEVSWDRARAVRESIERARAKAALLMAAKRSRRIRWTLVASALLMLGLLALLWVRQH